MDLKTSTFIVTGGASGLGEEGTDSAQAKINAALRIIDWPLQA